MRCSVGFGAILWVLSGPVAAQGPVPVSPGGSSGMAVVSGSCPTFLWTEVESADSVDLVIYRLPREEAPDAPERVRSVTLPATAQGWVPSLEHCLEPGARYAWSVRAGGEWSEASLFEVAPSPSLAEVEEALAVLRRYADAEGSEPRSQVPARGRRGAPFPEAAEARSGTIPPLRSQSVGPTPPGLTVTPPGFYALSIDGDFELGGFVFNEGYAFLHSDGGTTHRNTALGFNALINSTPGVPYHESGSYNTAIGAAALALNGTGHSNTAVGKDALVGNTTGSFNTASGGAALLFNSTGSGNTATGFGALSSSTSASYNTATGRSALQDNTSGSGNTASGFGALQQNTTGSHNTASGYTALNGNDAGSYNTAVGAEALLVSDASWNTALGAQALYQNTSGFQNTAAGHAALRDNTTGQQNTAFGQAALLENLVGSYNTAIGEDALRYATGSGNVALGRDAGRGATTGSDNIFIGNVGGSGDSGVIKIGDSDNTSTFIDGIFGVTPAGGVQVYVNSSNQLGTASSSRRFKEEIEDMEDASAGLLALRPVTFRYKEEAVGDGQRSVEFGLIAEEVAEIYPELVVYDEDGEPYSVRYGVLTPLLLNEVQEQHERLQRLQWLLAAGLGTGLAFTLGRRT